MSFGVLALWIGRRRPDFIFSLETSYRLALFACSKDRIQNEREQKYPAAGGQDGGYQPASARHYGFKPLGGAAAPLGKRRPLIALGGGMALGASRDYADDRTTTAPGKRSRVLRLMPALRVNSGTGAYRAGGSDRSHPRQFHQGMDRIFAIAKRVAQALPRD